VADYTLRHKADGTPYVQLYLGDNKVSGRQIRPYREFAGMSDAEAQEAAAEWVRQIVEAHKGGTSSRLGDRLRRYLDYLAADGRSYNTIKTYETFVGYCSSISRMEVDEVTPMVLNDLYTMLLTEGAHGTPLSHATVHSFRMFLQGAFRHLVSIGLVGFNPVNDSMRIHVTRAEAEAFDEESLRLVCRWIDAGLSEVPYTRVGIVRRNAAFALYLALHTGARAGEICAIRRSDVRLGMRTLSISGTVVQKGDEAVRQDRTKGKRSRNITLDERTVGPIQQHMRWQDGYLAAKGAKVPLVTSKGGFESPQMISHQFARMRRELGLDPSYHLHTFRHTHATWLLQSGLDARTVQERLGHARVETTLQLYGHVLPGRDAQAAAGFGDILDSITGARAS
jgi:integrase